MVPAAKLYHFIPGKEFCFSVSDFNGNFAAPFRKNNAKPAFRLWQKKKLPAIPKRRLTFYSWKTSVMQR
jgi:hypothetical protein